MNNSLKNTLTFKDFKVLLTSKFPNEQADIIASILKNTMLLHNDNLYKLEPNFTYKKINNDIKMEIYTASTKLIESSFKSFNDDIIDVIKETYDKYNKIFTNNFIDTLYSQLKTKLINNDIQFDLTLCEIHFNNGYYDLNANEFKERSPTSHYITHFINRDYKPSSESEQEHVFKHIKKIYRNENDMDCVLTNIASCLSGHSTDYQETLFLLGLGSSGKSFTLFLTSEAIGPYFKELQSDTFAVTNTKIDKILNTYATEPQIRISWVNEMSETRMQDTLFKSFCDGKLTTTKLFKDGQYNINHYSKCIVTANTMPNVRIDTGVSRRIVSYTHQSQFVEDANKVNEKKGIYIKDEKLLKTLKNGNFLNAWFDILALKCHKWLNGYKPTLTENFTETKSTICDANDIIQDFIDAKLKITDSKDRIGKNEMHEAFIKMYPKSLINNQQLITKLKDKNITYDYKLRNTNSIKGCFVGVRFKTKDDDQDQDQDSDEEDEIDYKKLYLEAKEEIKRLKNRLALDVII
jgi:hypothetical protein